MKTSINQTILFVKESLFGHILQRSIRPDNGVRWYDSKITRTCLNIFHRLIEPFLKKSTTWNHWPRVATIPPQNEIVRMMSWMRSNYYVSTDHVTNHVSKCWSITIANCNNSWRNWNNCLNRYKYCVCFLEDHLLTLCYYRRKPKLN